MVNFITNKTYIINITTTKDYEPFGEDRSNDLQKSNNSFMNTIIHYPMKLKLFVIYP